MNNETYCDMMMDKEVQVWFNSVDRLQVSFSDSIIDLKTKLAEEGFIERFQGDLIKLRNSYLVIKRAEHTFDGMIASKAVMREMINIFNKWSVFSKLNAGIKKMVFQDIEEYEFFCNAKPSIRNYTF